MHPPCERTGGTADCQGELLLEQMDFSNDESSKRSLDVWEQETRALPPTSIHEHILDKKEFIMTIGLVLIRSTRKSRR
jgi:hypothetical protein